MKVKLMEVVTGDRGGIYYQCVFSIPGHIPLSLPDKIVKTERIKGQEDVQC